MKTQKILFALFLLSFAFVSCKPEAKKEESKDKKEITVAKAEILSLNLSGMTCEMGCAKTIESKLARKEGVLEAKVVFTDSVATIKYDADKLTKTDLISFVEGIGDGSTYKASESTKKSCAADCKKENCTEKAEKKACAEDCKKECDAQKKAA